MTTLRHARVETMLGALTIVANDGEVTGVYFPGHWHLPDEATFGAVVDASTDALLNQARSELEEYFRGGRRDFDVPVRARGDEFSERVWTMLRDIPFGQTVSYGDLAERMGDRRQAQRVGQVVGRNPVSIIIPCHRVVGADGSLTGYAGGLQRKRRLLDLEEPAERAATRLF